MTETVAGKRSGWGDRCHRCGGLMVPEQVLEIRSMDFRCVSCGERIDLVILAHRKKDPESIEAEKVSPGKGKARLN
ncbi:MAG: hypothetical protein HC801_01375 [Nitrospira sp.]|nr:hypothetical protein [Nitrospira sp.]